MVKPLYQKEREVLNFHLSLQYVYIAEEVMEETFFKLAVNNEIIASSVTNKVGSCLPYYH